MASSTEQIHAALQDIFTKLKKAKGGQVDFEDLANAISRIDHALAPALQAEKALFREIHGMIAYIDKAKQDLNAPMQLESGQKIALASAELDAVVKTTEKAANRILDAAEQIQSAMNDVDDVRVQEKMLNAVTEIFEACNFQDLTGQRIRKVLETLSYLESKLRALAGETTSEDMQRLEEAQKLAAKGRPLTDEDLLNGPGAYGETPSQDDIDSLFNSLPKGQA